MTASPQRPRGTFSSLYSLLPAGTGFQHWPGALLSVWLSLSLSVCVSSCAPHTSERRDRRREQKLESEREREREGEASDVRGEKESDVSKSYKLNSPFDIRRFMARAQNHMTLPGNTVFVRQSLACTHASILHPHAYTLSSSQQIHHMRM